jgi:hypothetical protein
LYEFAALYPATATRATASLFAGAKQSLLKFHQTRTNRLRASQNAAALLSERGSVDIR